MVKYQKFWWVWHASTNRIGMVESVGVRGHRPYRIQFGSAGPFEWIGHADLLLASREQADLMNGTI